MRYCCIVPSSWQGVNRPKWTKWFTKLSTFYFTIRLQYHLKSGFVLMLSTYCTRLGLYDLSASDMRKSRPRKRHHVTPAGVIPKFRTDTTSNVTEWHDKIDQLGTIYGWRSTVRLFIMQLRLQGSKINRTISKPMTWDEQTKAIRRSILKYHSSVTYRHHF